MATAINHDAALILLDSLSKSGGRQASFNHPDLGGMGQWSQGAMTMIQNVADNDLKHRLDALCFDLTEMLADTANFSDSDMSGSYGSRDEGQQTRPMFFQKPPFSD